MSSSATPKIPTAWRIVLGLLDIALPLIGIATNTFMPLMALQNFTPKPNPQIALESYMLLDCTSGFFATLAFFNIYLLIYRPNDLTVWKGLVGAVLLQDLFMVGGFLRELRLRDGGVAVADWRGQDYGNVGGYAAIALIRGLFVLGVGVGGGRKGEKEL